MGQIKKIGCVSLVKNDICSDLQSNNSPYLTLSIAYIVG
jgi:C4-dicarboxylate transporter